MNEGQAQQALENAMTILRSEGHSPEDWEAVRIELQAAVDAEVQSNFLIPILDLIIKAVDLRMAGQRRKAREYLFTTFGACQFLIVEPTGVFFHLMLDEEDDDDDVI